MSLKSRVWPTSLLVLIACVAASPNRMVVAAETTAVPLAQSEAILGRLRGAMRDQAPLYFSAKTHAWYAQRLDRLPPARDVADLYPGPVGYGTGMDDCPLFAGTLLVALVELYDMTQAECLRAEAAEVYQGLKLCGTAHGVAGFVARGVSVEDLQSVYVTSSRDQYTHYVDGLWHYYHSPLSDEKAREEIRTLLAALADAMQQQVTAENDFGFLRADGIKDPRGLHKMWHVYAHEAARLPMIYAAAWDVAGKKEHYESYRQYLLPAIAQSIDLKNKPKSETDAWVPPYSYYQMQCSLALLARLEKDAEVKVRLLEAMTVAKTLAAGKTAWAARRSPRDLAELLLAQLMLPEFKLADAERQHLHELLQAEDLGRGGPPTTIHLLAAYCKACRSGLLPVPSHISPETWAPAPAAPNTASDAQPVELFPHPRTLVPQSRDEHLVVFLADPHAGASAANSSEAQENFTQFQEFCARIRAMRPRPAAVILAGDLAFAAGDRESYESLRPILARFDTEGIPWKVCLGETDRREAFLATFPEFDSKPSPVPGRLVDIVELPRADFILLDSSPARATGGGLDDAQRQWLTGQFEKYRQSNRPFFVVSHRPPDELGIGPLLVQAPTCLGAIHGHEHCWRRDTQSAPHRFGLPSTAYAAGAATRRAFTYLRMDRWEYVFRPVTADTDDLWERRIWVIPMAR